MGVYIDMEMPKTCNACKFACWSNMHQTGSCYLLDSKQCFDDYSTDYRTKRSENCPLIEIPPHGRLIDANALVKDLKRQCEEVFKIDAVSPDDFWIKRDKAYNERLWKTWCESFFEYLKARETIIEAEGRE